MTRRLPALVSVLLAAGAVALILASGGGSGAYRVRALFDDAGFAVPGEQVRIAGAPVGTIADLSVTPRHLAAVTLAITNRDFIPFHADARCTIRPQSLIAERFVDCTPGTAGAPALPRIAHGDGAGSHLLAVTRTSSPIDPDIVQNISQQSVRESLSIILNELGTGLAGRGAELNAVILRADPALAQTERVFGVLAAQNRVLAKLATDADTVLGPLARARRAVADFIVQGDRTAAAGAAERAQLAASIRLLPPFLRRLRPLMADLGRLAVRATPVVHDAGASAASLDAEFTTLVPFARRARAAILDLGSAAQRSQASLVAAQGLAERLGSVGTSAAPAAADLERLLGSLQSTGGIEQLMRLLFYGAGATNGYNADGHYVRLAPVVGPCTAYARAPIAGCSANFSGAAAAVARQAVAAVFHAPSGAGASGAASSRTLSGLLRYLTGARG